METANRYGTTIEEALRAAMIASGVYVSRAQASDIWQRAQQFLNE